MTSYSMYKHNMSNTQTLQDNPSSFSNPASNHAPAVAPAGTSASTIEQQHRIEHTAVAASLGWSGWGSPVGLGILVATSGFFVLCLHWAGIVH